LENLLQRSPILVGLLLAVLSAETCFAKPAAKDVSYTQWVNYRYGAFFDIPNGIFEAQAEPENSSGRAFVAKKYGIRINVYSAYNALSEPLSQMMQEEIAGLPHGSTVTYRRLTKSWYVFSARSGNRIIYEKRLLHDDLFNDLYVEYPANEAPWFNPIVTHISRSFHYQAIPTPADGRGLAGTTPVH